MQKRLVSLILSVLAVNLLFSLTIGDAQAKSALEVAKEFYKAAMEGDFKKLAVLGCKSAGPYTTYQDATKMDLTVFGFIEQVIREEDSGINLKNIKLVIVRVKAWGAITFGAFYLFESPKGYKVYISPKGEFLYEYPPDKIDVIQTAVDFYVSNKINLDKTIELVQTILKSKPNDLKANYRLGYLYSQEGWHQKALSQYRKLMMLDKDYAEKRIDPKDLIETWVSLLKHPISRELRFYAANKLYRIGKTELVKDAWLEMLKHPDRLVQFYAATRLYGIGDKRGVPVLMEKWKQAFKESRKSQEYEQAAKTLVEIGGKQAAPFLIEALSWNSLARRAAVKYLGETNDKGVVPHVKTALGKELAEHFVKRWFRDDHLPYYEALTKLTGQDWFGFYEPAFGDYTFWHLLSGSDKNWFYNRWSNAELAFAWYRRKPIAVNVKNVEEVEVVLPVVGNIKNVKGEQLLDIAAFSLKKIDDNWKITNVKLGLQPTEPMVARIVEYMYDYTAQVEFYGTGLEITRNTTQEASVTLAEEWFNLYDAIKWKGSHIIKADQLYLGISHLRILKDARKVDLTNHTMGVGYQVELKLGTFEDGSTIKKIILYKFQVLRKMKLPTNVPQKIEKTYKIIPLKAEIPKEKRPTVETQKKQKAPKAEEKALETAKKEEAKIRHVTARVSNADDKAVMYVNGQEAITVTWGTGPGGKSIGHRPGDSGWIDITPYLKVGDNTLRFWVWNKAVYGAVSATFEVQVNGVPVISRNFQKQDSTAGVKYDEAVILSLPNPRLKASEAEKKQKEETKIKSEVPLEEASLFSSPEKTIGICFNAILNRNPNLVFKCVTKEFGNDLKLIKQEEWEASTKDLQNRKVTEKELINDSHALIKIESSKLSLWNLLKKYKGKWEIVAWEESVEQL